MDQVWNFMIYDTSRVDYTKYYITYYCQKFIRNAILSYETLHQQKLFIGNIPETAEF